MSCENVLYLEIPYLPERCSPLKECWDPFPRSSRIRLPFVGNKQGRKRRARDDPRSFSAYISIPAQPPSSLRASGEGEGGTDAVDQRCWEQMRRYKGDYHTSG